MENLRFDEKTAKVLVKAAQKMKPIGVLRAYRVDQAFFLGETSGLAGDYLVLAPDGSVGVSTKRFVEKNFEPVKTRTRKNVPKA